MDSYSNLPHSYDGENATTNSLMGDYNFTVADYEVFTPVSSSKWTNTGGVSEEQRVFVYLQLALTIPTMLRFDIITSRKSKLIKNKNKCLRNTFSNEKKK